MHIYEDESQEKQEELYRLNRAITKLDKNTLLGVKHEPIQMEYIQIYSFSNVNIGDVGALRFTKYLTDMLDLIVSSICGSKLPENLTQLGKEINIEKILSEMSKTFGSITYKVLLNLREQC